MRGTITAVKYLGIDFGTKRIGLATSDEAGEFAFPKEVISFDQKAIDYIAALANEERIVTIVMGESVASNGGANTVASDAKKFAERLAEKAGIDVVFEREDFSSFEAHRYQTKAGNRDDSAAAVILQRFLDKQKK